MSGIKANWHLGDLTPPSGAGVDIEALAMRVDLNVSDEALDQRLGESLRQEANLDAIEVRCALKDQGQDCYRCPQFTADRQLPLSALCRLGRSQADMLGALRTRKAIRAREMDALAEAAGIPEALELAEACA